MSSWYIHVCVMVGTFDFILGVVFKVKGVCECCLITSVVVLNHAYNKFTLLVVLHSLS